MPELQPSAPTVPALPAAIDAVVPFAEDPDFALGCECADPALQIERWSQEARGGAAESA